MNSLLTCVRIIVNGTVILNGVSLSLIDEVTKLRIELGLVSLLFLFFLYIIIGHDVLSVSTSVPGNDPILFVHRNLNFPDGFNRVLTDILTASSIGFFFIVILDRKILVELLN